MVAMTTFIGVVKEVKEVGGAKEGGVGTGMGTADNG